MLGNGNGLGWFIPNFEALMRGINLEDLEKERFGTEEHEKLVKIHTQRVARFEQTVRFRDLAEKLAQIERENMSIWMRRKAREKTRKEAVEKDFPEHLIQMAMRSLEKNGR